MTLETNWIYGAQHMWDKHQVTVNQANEALADPDALLFNPDPKSKSKVSARLLGYSPSAATVLVVILVRRGEEDGHWWGANGWRANSSDRRVYKEAVRP